MKITIILAPYDSGHYRSGFGAGPDAILAGGLAEALSIEGQDVFVDDIGRVGDIQEREIATSFAVCNAVAEKVKTARSHSRFPVVLAGNCFSTIGSIAGEAADSLVWFDQHGDINTPETTPSGFLDGMALATALGQCWKPMASSVTGFKPVSSQKCILVDARDLDDGEKGIIQKLGVARISCNEVGGAAKKLRKAKTERTHLHLDLDVHNPKSLTVNRYGAEGGPDVQTLRNSVCEIASLLPVSGMSISAYDPSVDRDSAVPDAVKRLLIELLVVLKKE